MKSTAFTLLEVIISILILSIVTAGTYGLFVTNYKFIIEAKQRLQAVNQASAILEKLRMYVSEDPVGPLIGAELSNGTHFPKDIGLDDMPDIDGVSDNESSYIVEDINWDVEGDQALAIAPIDIKKVTVTVKWNEQ